MHLQTIFVIHRSLNLSQNLCLIIIIKSFYEFKHKHKTTFINLQRTNEISQNIFRILLNDSLVISHYVLNTDI